MHQVTVEYCVTETATAAAVESAAADLSPDERHRAERFIFPDDRRDYIIAHALLRRTLSRLYDAPPRDWRLLADARGKPSLAPAHGSRSIVSLSHSRGIVACGVSDADALGVDVERIDAARAQQAVAEYAFSASEQQFLGAGPREDYAARFADLWTLKEAYVKALGQGLHHPLADVGFSLETPGRILFSPAGKSDPRGWLFLLAAPTSRSRLAVAVAPAGATVVFRNAEQADGPPLRPFRATAGPDRAAPREAT